MVSDIENDNTNIVAKLVTTNIAVMEDYEAGFLQTECCAVSAGQ